MKRTAAANLLVSHLQCLLPFMHQCFFLIILVLPKVSKVDYMLPFSYRDESIKASPFLDDLKWSIWIYIIFCNIFSGISELYGVSGAPLLQQMEENYKAKWILIFFYLHVCVRALVSSLNGYALWIMAGVSMLASLCTPSTHTHKPLNLLLLISYGLENQRNKFLELWVD